MSRPGQPRLLEEMRRTMRRLHYSIHTERAYCVLQQAGQGVSSPLDDLGIWPERSSPVVRS